jgi:hypothetical protein
MIPDRVEGRETESVVVVEIEDDLGHHPKLLQKGRAEMTAVNPLVDPDHHRRHYREAEEKRVKIGQAVIDPSLHQRSFLRNRILTTEDLLVDHREVEVSRVNVHRVDPLVDLLAADHHPEEGIRKRIGRVVDLVLVL